MDGSARLPPFSSLDEDQKQTLYMAETLPPNLFLNIQPDYVNSHLMFPTGPESVRIVYDWLFEPRHLPLPEADLRHYVELWEVTNAQDARNCEWQQQGIHALPFEHGHYVPRKPRRNPASRGALRGAAGRACPSPTSHSPTAVGQNSRNSTIEGRRTPARS